MSTILSGPYDDLPNPAEHTGSFYYAADQGAYYYSDGGGWTQKTPPDLVQNGPDVDNIPGINASGSGFGFQIPPFNQISLSNYTGTHPGTIEYKLKGATVATINLTWDGDNLTDAIQEL